MRAWRSRATAGVAVLVLLAVPVCPAPVEALTTAMARFVEPAVAGPGIAQSVHLLVHYFPGNGEAVTGAVVTAGPADAIPPADPARVVAAASARGGARLEAGRVRLDYTAAPLPAATVDTVTLTLADAGPRGQREWLVEVHSTAQADGAPGFVATALLAVDDPVRVEVAAVPAQVFAGERLQMQVAVRNEDPAGRAVTRLAIDWPAGQVDAGSQFAASWSPPLAAGQADTVAGTVQVRATAAGRLEIPVRADADSVVGSPAGPMALEVWPLPRVVLAADAAGAVLGQRCVLACTIANPSEVTIGLQALRFDAGAAFDRIRVRLDPEGAGGGQVELRTEATANHVDLVGDWSLGPGARIRLEVEARPQRVGPNRWQILARPPGRDTFIALDGPTEVAVRRTAAPQEPGLRQQPAPTDLELLQSAIRASLADHAARLPLAPGASVALASAETKARDWVVADVLTRDLLARGLQVRVDAPERRQGPGAVLRYRLVDARVVCRTVRQRWRPWAKVARREAFADIVLLLEDGAGELTWTGHLYAVAADRIAGSQLEDTGSGDLVERTVVAADGKAVERGLTAVMLGGLIYIFFVL